LGEHVEGGMIVGGGGIEDGIGDRHGCGGAYQGDRAGLVLVASTEVQGNEAAHAVPRDGGSLNFQGIQQVGDPVAHLLDGSLGLAL
jgi:hypothetical protein